MQGSNDIIELCNCHGDVIRLELCVSATEQTAFVIDIGSSVYLLSSNCKFLSLSAFFNLIVSSGDNV